MGKQPGTVKSGSFASLKLKEGEERIVTAGTKDHWPAGSSWSHREQELGQRARVKSSQLLSSPLSSLLPVPSISQSQPERTRAPKVTQPTEVSFLCRTAERDRWRTHLGQRTNKEQPGQGPSSGVQVCEVRCQLDFSSWCRLSAVG
jgi:hypothetical protein